MKTMVEQEGGKERERERAKRGLFHSVGKMTAFLHVRTPCWHITYVYVCIDKNFKQSSGTNVPAYPLCTTISIVHIDCSD